VAAAFLRRDLAIAASYRLTFVMRALAIIVSLVALAFTARFVGASDDAQMVSRYGNAGYLGFWVIGIVVGDAFYSTSTALGGAIRRAQVEGTLDAMLSTPTPVGYVLLSAPLGQLAIALVRTLSTLLVASIMFDVAFRVEHPLALAAICATALVSFAALALLGGAVTMLIRRTDPITLALSMFGAVIGGVLYPVDLLPESLATVAYMFPLAPTLEALRLTLFAGAGFADITQELAPIAVFAALVGLAGALLFQHALRRARADGSLSHY
jgi:ABC-2 type transport system permease protein